MDQDEPECDCCGFINPVGKINKGEPPFPKFTKDGKEKPRPNLCDICYRTHAGTEYKYPSEHGRTIMLVAYVANQLRKDLQDLLGAKNTDVH